MYGNSQVGVRLRKGQEKAGRCFKNGKIQNFCNLTFVGQACLKHSDVHQNREQTLRYPTSVGLEGADLKDETMVADVASLRGYGKTLGRRNLKHLLMSLMSQSRSVPIAVMSKADISHWYLSIWSLRKSRPALELFDNDVLEALFMCSFASYSYRAILSKNLKNLLVCNNETWQSSWLIPLTCHITSGYFRLLVSRTIIVALGSSVSIVCTLSSAVRYVQTNLF